MSQPPYGPPGTPPGTPPGPPVRRRRSPVAVVLIVVGIAVVATIIAIPVYAHLNAQRIVSERQRDLDAQRGSASATAPGSAPASTTQPPSPSATAGSPTPSASSSASATPTEAGPGAGTSESRPAYSYTGRTARDNRVYNVVFAAGSLGCSPMPIRRGNVPDDQMKAYGNQVVACLTAQLKAPLAKQGVTLTQPKVVVISANTQSPCGTVDVRRWPAYYCTGDETIYLNTVANDYAGNYASLSMGFWLVLSHEFGHHVQHRSGIFADYTSQVASASTSGRQALSRRLELQASCFGAVELNAMWKSLGLTRSDYAEFSIFNDQIDDSRYHDHGSAASNQRWFDRGYRGDWSSYGDCNTWTAAATTVS